MNLPLSHIFIPSLKPSDKLIIILHGRGDSAEGFRFFPQELGFDDINYLLLNAPTESYPGFSWYDFPPNQLEGIQNSSILLTQTLDEVFTQNFKPESTILFGFSQGSLLTFEFGARYEKILAGYMAISGYIYDASKISLEANTLVKQAPWFCSHGYEDEVLAYELSRQQVQTLQDAKFNIDFKSYHKTHTIARDEIEDMKVFIATTFS